LPNKVLIEIGGKTVLQHVWETSRAAGLGPEPIIATDSERVAEAAAGFGAPVAMTSGQHTCGSERVAEVARSLDCELIVNLQADEVLIEPQLIASLPGVFEEKEVQMATAVAPFAEDDDIHDPSLVKAVLDANGDAMYFSRLPIPFSAAGGNSGPPLYGHLGIYAFRRDFLLDVYSRPQADLEKTERLEQLRVLQAGYRIRALIWHARHFGLNTPADLERVRGVLESENP